MKIRVADRAKFQADRMAKVALATTSRAQLDLYCLEPGQSQKPHVHADQDKIYYVLEGRGRFTVNDAEEAAEAGEAIVAAAGAAHGVRNDSGARLLLLVVVTPPPPHA
ncbi:MAG: cupin domain-containing protein [Candidatus Rokuibacteriota bacterium]